MPDGLVVRCALVRLELVAYQLCRRVLGRVVLGQLRLSPQPALGHGRRRLVRVLDDACYAELFGDARPARTVIPVPELHYGYLVEVDAIAVRMSAPG